MFLRNRWVLTTVILFMLTAGLSVIVPQSVAARERPSPHISLSVYACPPGMTEATLATVDCTPVTGGFDVDIVSIDGTQARISVADGTQDGHVVRWMVTPSDAEVDNWGLRQTAVPAGTIAYLLQGESVEFRPSAVYDYRFQTSAAAAQTDLSMYLLFSASQGVIIPPGSESPGQTAEDTPQENTDPATDSAVEEEPATTQTPEPAAAPEPGATSAAQPAETPISTETVTQDNVAIRLAADLSAVIIDTVEAGEVVDVLDGPIQAGNDLWYQVVSSTNARGWIQSFAFEEAVAESTERTTQAVDVTATTQSAVVVDLQPGDRATVIDPPLNLRAQPDPKAEVLISLDAGQLLRIDATAGSAGGFQWVAVSLLPNTGVAGYVAGEFLEEVGLMTGDIVSVTTGDANIRIQPSLQSGTLGKMSAGAAGSIIGGPVSADGYDWFLILLDDNRSGWVAGSLLQLAGTAVEPVESANPAESDSVAPAVLPAEAFRAGAWVRVTEPPINLRSQPDPDAVALEALEAGDVLVILSGPESSGGYTWYLVDVNGVQGYAAGEFLAGGYLPGETVQAIGASVYLRSEPGVTADIVTSLPVGQTATVLSPDPLRDGEFLWILIRTETGETGYVATRFIEPATG